MDRIQGKLITLLQEIHDICESRQIKYVLNPQTAVQICENGRLVPGEYTAGIYMTYNDFLIFQEAVKEADNPSRVIEGMNNNPRFPGFFFRYTDVDTTFYSYNFGNTYVYNGINITIEILRRIPNHSFADLRSKEKGFACNSFKYRRWLSIPGKWNKFRTRLAMIGGREAYSKRLFAKFVKTYTLRMDFDTDYAFVNRTTFKYVKYPTYLYLDRKLVKTGRHEFYAACDVNLQYEIITGKKIEDTEPLNINNFAVIVSSEIPYNEYLTDMDARLRLARKRQQLWLTDQMHGTVTYFMNRDWAVMKCVSARLDMISKYMPIKAELISLYNDKNFSSLIELLKDYDTNIRLHYTNTKMTIYFDRDIFDIYRSCLELNDESDFAKKLVKHIPQEWKTKKVEQ